MALAVGPTTPTKKYHISASHVLCRGESRRSNGLASSVLMKDVGRRSLLSILLLGSTATVPEPDSKKTLLQKYLKKSEENKVKNDKEVVVAMGWVWTGPGRPKSMTQPDVCPAYTVYVPCVKNNIGHEKNGRCTCYMPCTKNNIGIEKNGQLKKECPNSAYMCG